MPAANTCLAYSLCAEQGNDRGNCRIPSRSLPELLSFPARSATLFPKQKRFLPEYVHPNASCKTGAATHRRQINDAIHVIADVDRQKVFQRVHSPSRQRILVGLHKTKIEFCDDSPRFVHFIACLADIRSLHQIVINSKLSTLAIYISPFFSLKRCCLIYGAYQFIILDIYEIFLKNISRGVLSC